MTVFERLYQVIVRSFGKTNRTPPPIESITPECNLKNDIGLDSLTFVITMLEIENEFKISIPVESIADCETVGQVVDTIESALN